MASEWLFPTETTSHEENVSKNRHEDIFVFGYACKLFRDDEQARVVDKGKYMIPWMGDERLQIDRYDGRGHLYDLRSYDADNLKGKGQVELSDDEKQIEQLCDEERYLELHTDLAEKAMYEEEEWKRYYESLDEGYKAVGFSYDSFGQPQPLQEAEIPEEKPDPGELPYEPPTSLQVPKGMELPATVKEQAIVEKTAKFIAEHGVQMEIMMKTKQANNPQFLFMHFEDSLHPFYKHMVKMIKSKKYIPTIEKKEENLNDSGEAEDGSHAYLHPDLLTTNRASPTPEVYKPIPIQMPKVSIHETSYGQLLQSMSKVNQSLEEKKNRNKEIKKEIKTEPYDSTSVYSQNNMPPPPGIEPVTLPNTSEDSNGMEIKQELLDNDGQPIRSTSPMPQIVPPPPDAQPVVDRMAMYVAKNGEEFEVVVKSKNDQRFQFLETWHLHYGYYLFKKQLFIQEIEKERKKKEEEEKQAEREKAEKLAKGVKFKLKKAKEQEGSTLEKKMVFDNDESSDEEQGGGDGRKERRNKSDRSGTSTPVTDHDPVVDTKHDELLEKRLAEQKVKDRLAASAREKLSQVDKDKQIKAERKKKAAMFINLLKSKTTGEPEADSKTDNNLPTQSNSARSSPVKQEERRSSHHKSKHKTRDRSRDRNRSRSRSRSPSRSKKKKRRRSHTPPSAYATTRRSPMKLPPLPPPSRYGDSRSRYSRSPSQNKRSRRPSRSRSRSPTRSKSKKKKRSKSPKNKQEDSSHRKSSKKKKKRSRSRSRSKDKKVKKAIKVEVSTDADKSQSAGVTVPVSVDARVASPAAEGSRLSTVVEELEDGETRDSSPEPGELEEPQQSSEDLFKCSKESPGQDTIGSNVASNTPIARSSTGSPISTHSSSRSPSPSKQSKTGDQSRSRSHSPYGGSSTLASHVSVGESNDVSRDGTPTGLDTVQNGAGDEEPEAAKSVSKYMLSRVRELIKASKSAVKDGEEEEMEDS